MTRPRLHILSVLPSPYQRDLFSSWVNQPEWDTHVYYLEASAPDSPWGAPELQTWETVLPGHTIGKGRVRCHRASSLGSFTEADHWVLNVALTGWTAQRLMRHHLPPKKWHFWGEVLRDRPPGPKRWLQEYLTAPLHKAAGIVAIGSRAEASFGQRFPTQLIHRVDYAPDTHAFSKAATTTKPRSDKKLRILFCGQMIKRKGIDLLLNAFARLSPTLPDVELHLAGREADLNRWLEPLPDAIRKQVIVHGFLAPEELPDLFATMDLFALPSRHDGWGVVINQAIAAHLPVIATTTAGAAADLIEPHANGLLIPPNDVDALEEALLKLLKDGALRRSMRANQSRHAESMTSAFAARRWVDILDAFGQNRRS